MDKITFKDGREFVIENPKYTVYILQGVPEDSTYAANALLDSYKYTNFKHIAEYKSQFELWKDMDENVVIDWLFKDLEEVGNEELCNAMADTQYVLFYVHNGLSVPDGPLPWE